jgi:hypothetical protein
MVSDQQVREERAHDASELAAAPAARLHSEAAEAARCADLAQAGAQQEQLPPGPEPRPAGTL